MHLPHLLVHAGPPTLCHPPRPDHVPTWPPPLHIPTPPQTLPPCCACCALATTPARLVTLHRPPSAANSSRSACRTGSSAHSRQQRPDAQGGHPHCYAASCGIRQAGSSTTKPLAPAAAVSVAGTGLQVPIGRRQEVGLQKGRQEPVDCQNLHLGNQGI